MSVLPFFKPAYHRLPRQSKMDRQARPCYFLNFRYNHGSVCFKITDVETGSIVHSCDVTWHQPREPLISPVPTAGLGVPQSPSGVETLDFVHIQTAPAAIATPTAAPVPASATAAPAPLPAPLQNLSASIPDRIVCELGHEVDVRMPCCTRGDTSAMRDSPHSMSLLYRAALAQGMATREAFDEVFREHELPPPDADFPTALASDVSTPSTVTEAGLSQHASKRRGSRTREFRGLLQAITFGPA